jgi:hypothetical protein
MIRDPLYTMDPLYTPWNVYIYDGPPIYNTPPWIVYIRWTPPDIPPGLYIYDGPPLYIDKEGGTPYISIKTALITQTHTPLSI